MESKAVVSPNLPGENTPITNDNQRKECVREMRKNYRLYKKVHGRVEKVSSEFASLEIQLRNAKKNTAEYKVVADKVKKLYKETKKDIGYETTKKQTIYTLNS